jgi:hypothetical protein
VLELLGTDLTQHRITAELYFSPTTEETRARATYRKLGVSSPREEAGASPPRRSDLSSLLSANSLSKQRFFTRMRSARG